MMPVDDDLKTLAEKALATGAPPPSVEPKAESLDDLAAVANKAIKDREEAVFKERQKRMGIPIIPKDGQAVTAAAMGVVGGMVKGLFTPISAYMPDAWNDKLDAWEEDSVRKMLGMQAKSEHRTAYEASPGFSRALAKAPSFTGEMVGMTPPMLGTIGAVKTLADVEKSASLLARVGKSIASASAAGGLFSAAAKLDPGESRWARVAQDSVVMGAFELVGIPAMRRAWLEESPALAKKVIEATGADAGKVATEITNIRAGVPAAPEVVEAVINAAKADPTLANKPAVLQAVKQREARKRVQSPTTIIDAGIRADSPHFLARMQITADGKPVEAADIIRLPGMTDADVAKQVAAYKANIKQLQANGVDVRVNTIIAGDQEGAQLVLNELQGRAVKPPNPDKAKRKVPGAAPPASAAESGEVPGVGATVNVKEPDKPIVQAKVVEAAPIPSEALAALPEALPGETASAYYSRMQGLGKTVTKRGAQAKVKAAAAEPAKPVAPPTRPDLVPVGLEEEFNKARVAAQPPKQDVNEALYQRALAAHQEKNVAAGAAKQKPKGKMTAEEKADAFARQAEEEAKSLVTVELPDKTVAQVPLAHVQIPLERGVKQSVTLKPHLDGSDRRAIIHLDDGQISFESVGGARDPSSNYFRSGMFDEVNPDIQWGRDPRVWISKDMTRPQSGESVLYLSVPSFPEAQRVTRRGFMQVFSEKAKDVEERVSGGALGTVVGKEKAATWKKNLTEGPDIEPEDITAFAGFEQMAQQIPRELRKHPLVQGYFDEAADFLSEMMDEGGRIPRGTILNDMLAYFTEGGVNEESWKGKKGVKALVKQIKGLIDKEQLKGPAKGSVEMVTAKRAAKVMLGNGIAPSTQVWVGVAKASHSAADVYTAGEKYTLKQLAEMELPLANMSRLADDAAERGLTVAPYGQQVTLTSKGGFSRTFGNSLEAHEAVLRMPKSSPDVKIEAALEREWKMGSERAWDPEVDINRYIPVQAQEAAFQELVDGKRPLTLVYTTDADSLTMTVRQLEKNLGAKPDSLRIQLLPALDDDKRKAAAIYNHDAVATLSAKARDALTYVGVTAKEPSDVIRQLSLKGKGHGIYIVSGRDPYSAALYSRWRDMGSKELWEMGRVEMDALGPYRRYSAEAKKVIKYPGAGDEYYPVDIADSFGPPAVNFSPDASYKPRPAEEIEEFKPRWTPKEPPEGKYYDTGGALTYMTNRFRPMMELAKDLQARTGAPFYEWYRKVEVGREKLTRAIYPYMNQVSELARGLNKRQRQEVQLILEAPGDMGLQQKVGPKVVETAAKLQKVYEQFFYDQNFSVRAVRELFDSFPHIRKADGNFRYAMRGRSAIPEIAQLLSKDLENGVIMIDGRELDFQRIANRLIRSTATERIMQPPWKMVKTEMEAWAEARRIPGDYANIFHSYLREVLHMPDDLHMSLSRMVKKIGDKLGGRMTELEAEDAVTMFSQMNYFTNLAWRPGTAAKNLLQVLQTTYPIMGNDTWKGYRMGLKWWKDKKLQEEMVRRGIVAPDGIYGPLQELSRLTETGGKMGRALDVFFNKGTRWHANTDDFNRVVSYWAQYEKGMRYAKQYAEGKIDWAGFLEKSKADMRDAAGGPFTVELKQLFDTKGAEAAVSRLSEEFAKATQFVYTRGNSPYVMQSTAGRFFLQYGTWPAWYAENLRSMLMRGSRANRAKALARWTAVQGSMFAGASAVFGTDFSRWTFFAPLGYSGGPALQLAQQGMEVWSNAVDPSNNDPVARIAKARLMKGITRQLTPLPLGAFTDVLRATEAFDNADLPSATRAILGLPATTPQQQQQLMNRLPF